MERHEYLNEEIIETYRRLQELQVRIEASKETTLDLAKLYRELVLAPGGCITNNLMSSFESFSKFRIAATLDPNEIDLFIGFLNERAEEIAAHTSLSTLAELCKDIERYKRWEASKPFQAALGRELESEDIKGFRNYQFAILNFLRLKGMTAKQEGRTEDLEKCVQQLRSLDVRADYKDKRNKDVNDLLTKDITPRGEVRDFLVLMNFAEAGIMPKKRNLDRSLEQIGKLIKKIEDGESPEGIMPKTYGSLVNNAMIIYDQILFLAANQEVLNPKEETERVLREMAELCRRGLKHLDKFAHGQLDNVALKLEKIGEKWLAVQYLRQYFSIVDEPGILGDFAPQQRSSTLYRLAKLADELSAMGMEYNDTARDAIDKAIALNPQTTKFKWFKKQLEGKDLSMRKEMENILEGGAASRDKALTFLRTYPSEHPGQYEKGMNSYAPLLAKLIRLYVDVKEYEAIKESWSLNMDSEVYSELDRAFELVKKYPLMEIFLRWRDPNSLLYKSLDELVELYEKPSHKDFLTALKERLAISGEKMTTDIAPFLRKYFFEKETIEKLRPEPECFIPLKILILQCSDEGDCIRLMDHLMKLLDAVKPEKFVVPPYYEKDLSIRLLQGGDYENALKYIDRSLRRGFTVEQARIKNEILLQTGRPTPEQVVNDLLKECVAIRRGTGDRDKAAGLLEKARELVKIPRTDTDYWIHRRERTYELLYHYPKLKDALAKTAEKTKVYFPEMAEGASEMLRIMEKVRKVHSQFLSELPMIFYNFRRKGINVLNQFWVQWSSFYLKFDVMHEDVRQHLGRSLEGVTESDVELMQRHLLPLLNRVSAITTLEKYDRLRFQHELLEICEEKARRTGGTKYEPIAMTLRQSLGLRGYEQLYSEELPYEKPHAPTEMARFFKAINSGGPLKRLTHPVDAVKDGKSEIEDRDYTAAELWAAMKGLVEKMAASNRMPEALEQMLTDYLTGSRGWKDARGERHDSWQMHAAEIEGGTFPLNDARLQGAIAFDKLRNSIRLIPDEPEGTKMSDILMDINTKLGNSIAFEGLESVAGIKMFCDVKSVSAGLELMLKDIASHRQPGDERARVRVDYTKNEAGEHDMTVFTMRLTQKGTKVETSHNSMQRKFRDGGGTFSRIGKLLRNVCDWAVEAQWKDGKEITRARQLELLTDESVDMPFHFSDIEADEFRHILTFYN
ncbi:MAG: hypothetical protein K2M06_01270 [Muribaculaceae bacterium]|nr:hypothetical protein [Muribaculaceae bacterium]